MRDYSGYYEKSNDKILHNAEIMFIKQLESNEAKDVVIDGVLERVLVRNHTNEMNEKAEERYLYTKVDTIATLGSKVELEERPNKKEIYIITADLDYHYSYLKTKIKKTNHTLKFWSPYGKLIEERCFFDGTTLWNTGIENNMNSPFAIGSAKANAVFKYNENTKLLDRGVRFIANKTAYKVTTLNINKEGLITAVYEETQVKDGLDDLINEIPHNPYLKPVIVALEPNISLALGSTSQISCRITQDKNEIQAELLYSTSDETIATIDKTGLLTTVGLGSVTIKISLADDPTVFTEVYCDVLESTSSSITHDVISDVGFSIRKNVTGTFEAKKYDNGVEIPSSWTFTIDYMDMSESSIVLSDITGNSIDIKALSDNGMFKLIATEVDGTIIEKEIRLKGAWG